ncbi:MAG: hypothetical protein P8X94_10905 [Woeseiaceae bacterium]
MTKPGIDDGGIRQHRLPAERQVTEENRGGIDEQQRRHKMEKLRRGDLSQQEEESRDGAQYGEYAKR